MGISTETVEMVGSIFGLIGALLLASNTKVSKFGWISYLVANVAMLMFAMDIGAKWMLIQQIGFTLTSLLGLYRVRDQFKQCIR